MSGASVRGCVSATVYAFIVSCVLGCGRGEPETSSPSPPSPSTVPVASATERPATTAAVMDEARTDADLVAVPPPRGWVPPTRLAFRGGACVLSEGGEVVCRGEPVLEGAVELTVGGGRRACARRTDGSVWCWSDSAPTRIAGPAVAVVMGGERACVRGHDRRVRCEVEGGLRRVEGLASVVSLAATDGGVFCARTRDRRVACWQGTRAPLDTEPPLTDARDLAGGGDRVCAIRGEDRRVTCWGGGRTEEVAGLSGVRQLGVGQGMICGLTGERELVCSRGEEGRVSTEARNVEPGAELVCDLDGCCLRRPEASPRCVG